MPLEMIETLDWRTEQARRVTSSRPASQQALQGFSGGVPALVVFVHGSIEGRARYSAFRRIGPEKRPAKP
jgi:hypothetical protein